MKAIVVLEKGKAAVQEVPLPKLRDQYVLVKVKAVGLNPTDWKGIESGQATPGCRVGCDFAGVVEEVGSKVTKFQKGDRIAGIAHGGSRFNPEFGSFGEYAIAKEHAQIKIPESITDEQAATLGVSITTVAQGLYKTLGLPLPTSPSKKTPSTILIYGGSTATGIYGIQYAKASGLTVVATASPHNFEYLKSLGADAVFDYKSPSCGADIRAHTDNRLVLAWDCTGAGAEVCAAALSDGVASRYASIIPVDGEALRRANPSVDGPHLTLAYDALGEPFYWYGDVVPAKPDEVEYAAMFWELSREPLARGTVRPIRPIVNQGGAGLEGVLKGLDELRAGRVSAAKLVYTL